MLSPRWLIGITLFMVCAFLLSNWIDGFPLFTSQQASNITTMTEHTTVSVTNPAGGLVNYVNIAVSALNQIGMALTWDYSFFHDKDAAGNDQNTDLAMVLFFIRMCFMSISVGIIFQMAYLLRQIVAG
jgi:hypothetical protein